MFLQPPQPPSSTATTPGERFQYIEMLVKQGLMEFARSAALELVDDHPEFPGGYAALVEVAWNQNDYVAAMNYAIRGVELDPDGLAMLSKAAASASRSGFADIAEDYARRLVAKAPNEAASHLQLADTYERINRGEEALEQAEIAKSIDPSCAWVVLAGKAQMKLKNLDEAERLLREGLANEQYSDDIRVEAGFALTKLFDRSGHYDEAWETAEESHRIGGKPFPVEKRQKVVNDILKEFSARNLKLWRREGFEYERAVFVLGMPRSGTSLMEQILQMHPDVGAVGELAVTWVMMYRLQRELDSYLPYPKCLIDLLPQNIADMQALYTDAIDVAAKGKRRVVNKVLNTYETLGMLSVLLPGLRAVHIKRHPLDNLVSCHTTNLLASGHTYTSKLEDLALMYRTRQQLARHWQEVLDVEIHEVSYEKLTADQEGESRRLIDYLGLDWDDRVLEFHKSKRVPATISYDQVGQKMYTTSVARWRNYEKHLGPLIDALGDELDNWEV